MSSLNAKIDALYELREKKRGHEEQVKELNKQYQILEAELIAAMQKEGVESTRGKKATVSISTSIKPQVEDWEEFYRFIRRKNYFHLLERRPSVTGCRELFETKGVVPGVVPFTATTLNIRTVR